MSKTTKLNEWIKKNPDRFKQSVKNWQKNNKDKIKAWRDANKEKLRICEKNWRKRNKERVLSVQKKRTARQFFMSRAIACVKRNENGDKKQVANDIFWLWHKQRGRCALTGQRLDRTAELDHIIPVSRGGTNERSNLQWLCRKVNRYKLNMTNDELLELCKTILSYKL